MSLGLYFETAGLRFDTMLQEIADLGTSHVGFVVQWAQADIRAMRIAPNRLETLPDARLRQVIRRAHALGMKVFLLPIVHLQKRARGEWRGKIRPPDWNIWWRAYTRFISHYAALSEEEGVSILSVGSELVTTERMKGRWEQLVKEVRGMYKGKLLYSANWDHYEPVSFWPAVDYVGLTGYYRLTKKDDASQEELTKAWAGIRSELVAFQRRVAKPLIFTEVGYPSQDGAARHPWDYTTGRPADLEEQRRCYQAFVSTWDDEPALAGVFFWNWFGYGGKRSTYYTPRHKPAAAIVRSWYHVGDQEPPAALDKGPQAPKDHRPERIRERR